MKQRLDILLVERGLFPSRDRAQRAVMAGQVYSAGRVMDKPGMKVDTEAELVVSGPDIPYVSRGGLKLEKALRQFNIDPSGRVAIDVGASTGGFTDCLLQHGAMMVYAVDVGYGQLAQKLRNDPRVRVMERINARELTPALFSPSPDMATVDVSFISLAKVIPAILDCLSGAGPIITLIKPQFEAGRELVGKKGVVRDPEVHRDVILRVARRLGEAGLRLDNLTGSPIRGPEGNIEFLALWSRGAFQQADCGLVEAVVAQAHHPDETGS